MMNGRGKSDSFVVPGKPPNKAEEPAAEVVEGRGLAEGNLPERNIHRTQSREGMPSALERVRQAARRDRKQRFTTLLHHVYDTERLRSAYFALKRDAAAGVDGVTWRQYGEHLEANLDDLSARLSRLHAPIPEQGAYLRAVVMGHVRYYGVPMNGTAIGAFRKAIGWLWWRLLGRRSQTGFVPWKRMTRLVTRWLPPARICHPYPLARLAVTTRGRSRMR
jgi:hypothetical protein